MASKAARLLGTLAFLALGASFVLQLLVAIGLPYIKSFYFLRITGKDSHSLYFGIWSACGPLKNSADGCRSVSLGYENISFDSSNADVSNFNAAINKGLAHALVLQPIAAGLVGLAAGAAFLSIFARTILWVLAAILALLVTYAALAVELAFFIIMHDRLKKIPGFSVDYGPALWMQVGGAAAASAGCLAAIATYAAPRRDRAPPGYNEELRNAHYDPALMHAPSDDHLKYAYEAPYVPEPAYPAQPPLEPTYVAPVPPLQPHGGYDPREAGGRTPEFEKRHSRRHSREPRRHSRRHLRRHSREPRRHSRRYSRRHSRHESYPPRAAHEYDYDYDYTMPPRRRSYEYGRRRERAAPAPEPRPGTWTRYSERGAF